MSQEIKQAASSAMPTKTYLRGTFLYSTDDGTGYEQKNRNRVEQQVMIEDKANLGQLKRQIQSKKQEISKKRQKAKKEKQMLIPIRDTPVQPLPQPSMDNSKCERATQQQFEYFQTYISLKQKQKKFQQEERTRIEIFQKQQEKFRKNQENEERKSISIVIHKEDPITFAGNKSTIKKKGPSIKVVIKKKQVPEKQKANGLRNPQQIIQKSQQDKQKNGDFQNQEVKSNNENQNNEEQEEVLRKVRVVEQV